MEAEILPGRVLPEIQTTLDLEVATVNSAAQTVSISVFLAEVLVERIVIVINEEEGVTELVRFEHFESRREILAIFSEIVEGLKIDLGIGHEAKTNGCKGNQNSFFEHKM